jgi:hypothetical protein
MDPFRSKEYPRVREPILKKNSRCNASDSYRRFGNLAQQPTNCHEPKLLFGLEQLAKTIRRTLVLDSFRPKDNRNRRAQRSQQDSLVSLSTSSKEAFPFRPSENLAPARLAFSFMESRVSLLDRRIPRLEVNSSFALKRKPVFP